MEKWEWAGVRWGREGEKVEEGKNVLFTQLLFAFQIYSYIARCSVIVVKKNNLLALMRVTVPGIQHLLLSANQMYMNT